MVENIFRPYLDAENVSLTYVKQLKLFNATDNIQIFVHKKAQPFTFALLLLVLELLSSVVVIPF